MSPEQAKQLGDYVRREREQRGVSARQLATQIYVDMAQVLRLEKGMVASPKADMLANISRVLELPLADLYGLAGYPTTAELPSFKPYLRTKYKDELSDEAVGELEQFLERLRAKHGASGPADGEDEG